MARPRKLGAGLVSVVVTREDATWLLGRAGDGVTRCYDAAAASVLDGDTKSHDECLEDAERYARLLIAARAAIKGGE